MPDDSASFLEIETMDAARAQGFKTVDPLFDPNSVREGGFFVEGSNPIRSAEYHADEGFRVGQLQGLSDLHREAAAVNGGGGGGGGPQYFDWPLPASASASEGLLQGSSNDLEGLLQGNGNNLGAWPAMAAGLSSGAQAEINPNVLLSNLSVLQQKAQQLEAFVQEGRHDQPASGVISSILYELIVTAASVLVSVQNRGIANPVSADVHPVPDPSACVDIQAKNRAPPVGSGFGKPPNPTPNPNGASDVGFAGVIDLQDEKSPVDIKAEGEEEESLPDNRFYDIIEINEDDILAEHTHFCEICGKGFRRDANVRMHMRAHGDEYKTNQALMSRPAEQANKPPATSSSSSCSPPRARRYSCPFEKCRRNKNHRNFMPLKSITSLRNHYKRSHCPKMYTCHKCNKQFSVVGDLKTHGKHCGHNPWRCSCGTTFTRKDKLFGHVALFEGHRPVLPLGEAAAKPEEEKGIPGNGHRPNFFVGDPAGPVNNTQSYGNSSGDDMLFNAGSSHQNHIDGRFCESDVFWTGFSG